MHPNNHKFTKADCIKGANGRSGICPACDIKNA